MVTVTDRAKHELKTVLSEHTQDDDQGLRLVVTPTGQLGLGLDVARDGDQVVECEGAKVLLVGEEISPALDGATVDVEETLTGPRLTIGKA